MNSLPSVARTQTAPSVNRSNFTLAACNRILAEMDKARSQILGSFRGLISEGQRGLVNHAIEEAEALAWETGFPHLLFPVLALEKASAAADSQLNHFATAATSEARAFAA